MSVVAMGTCMCAAAWESPVTVCSCSKSTHGFGVCVGGGGGACTLGCGQLELFYL